MADVRRPRTQSWRQAQVREQSLRAEPEFYDLTDDVSADAAEEIAAGDEVTEAEKPPGLPTEADPKNEDCDSANNPANENYSGPFSPFAELPSDGEDEDLEWKLGDLLKRIERRDQRRFNWESWDLSHRIIKTRAKMHAAEMELAIIRAERHVEQLKARFRCGG